MSRVQPDVWTRLGGEHVQGESFWARRALPEISDRLIAALDADGKRHLLVSLTAGEQYLRDTQSRGLEVVTRELHVPGQGFGRFLDVICHDGTGHEALDVIGGELADRLSTERETAPEVVTRVLAKWRRFWGEQSKQLLSPQRQIGLFAEIWFLSVWLVPTVGAADAVTAWRGPVGSRHDFEWPERSVEVKATTSTRGLIHHVNGLDQLAPPDNGVLLFFSMQLREEGGATNSLPSVIGACRGLLEASPDALGAFEHTLSRAGYSPLHEDEYDQLRLRVVTEGLYRVELGFPRLTSDSFETSVPAGVESVEYEINLAGCEHLKIATSSAESPTIWPNV